MSRSRAHPVSNVLNRGTTSVRRFHQVIRVQLSKGPSMGALFAYDRDTKYLLLAKPFVSWLWDSVPYRVKEDFVVTFLRKLKASDIRGPGGVMAEDPQWAKDYPALHEWMTALRGPDGKPRQVCTLTVFAAEGAWKAFLNERDAGMYLAATGDSVAAVLAILEGLLVAPETPWRGSTRFPNGPPPKKGKAR
jgi:hypothetical protein